MSTLQENLSYKADYKSLSDTMHLWFGIQNKRTLDDMNKEDCIRCEWYKEGQCFGFSQIGEDIGIKDEFMCGEFRSRI